MDTLAYANRYYRFRVRRAGGGSTVSVDADDAAAALARFGYDATRRIVRDAAAAHDAEMLANPPGPRVRPRPTRSRAARAALRAALASAATTAAEVPNAR